MKAWVVREFGPFRESLRLETIPRPTPSEGRAIVRTHLAGLNFPDTLLVAGRYQVRPSLPFVPGFEAVGTVVEPGTCSFKPGDRVLCWTQNGAFAEYLDLPCEHLLEIPQAMPDPEAAAFLVSYQTAYFTLVHRGRLASGDTVLVHGGAGGLGTAAVQIATALGATVIATASSADKLDFCRLNGAHHVVNYAEESFERVVLELTGGRGVDLVLDPVGGDTFLKSLRCLAWEGRILSLGFASGQIPVLKLNRVLLKNVEVVGLYWGEYWSRDIDLVRKTHHKLIEHYLRKDLRPRVHQVLPMRDVQKGLAKFEARTHLGKMVVDFR